MDRWGLRVALAALACLAGGAAAGQGAPQFSLSTTLPDLPAEPPRPAPLSLYDVFATPDVSPLGVPVGKVEAENLFDEAANALRGPDGHPANPQEAAFWLKRAILAAPDPTGRRRAWAVMRLGALFYISGEPGGHRIARDLWELAGAWHDPQALCNLGQLIELGDDITKADPPRALVWYERARQVGCPQAEGAINRLRH